MATPAGDESAYLVATVGDALARGVAATVSAAPDDPVAHLGEWLLRFVAAEQQAAARAKEKKAAAAAEQRRAARAAEAAAAAAAAEAARRTAVAGLAALVAEPALLWSTTVQLVKRHTSAGAAYVAAIVDEERPDWAPPGEGEADAESEDEAGGAEPGAGGDGDDGGGDGERDEADGGGGGAGEGGEGGGPPGLPPPPDYAGKLLRYVAASAGQEFMTTLTLRRPAPEDGDAGGAARPEAGPVTFRLLDEHVPLLQARAGAGRLARRGGLRAASAAAHPLTRSPARRVQVPHVADEPRVTFLRGPPRIGGYVAQALGQALDGAAAARKADAARGGGAEALAALAAAVAELRAAAPPFAPVPEDEEDAAPGEEEGGGEGGEPLAPEELVSRAEAQLAAAERRAEAGAAAAARARRRRSSWSSALAPSSPPSTAAVLRGALLLLGRAPSALASWRELSAALTAGLFDELGAFDATQDRDAALWGRVRAAYKVASARELERELPQCGLGAMLLQWVKQSEPSRRPQQPRPVLPGVPAPCARSRARGPAAARARRRAERARAASSSSGARRLRRSPPPPRTSLTDVAGLGGGDAGGFSDEGSNPLEALRVTRDVRARAALMSRLLSGGAMSHYSARYVPTDVEAFLAAELGVGGHAVMLWAVAPPGLPPGLELDAQVRPAVRSLKAANVDVADIWFLLGRNRDLLAHPVPLQRWLDLLGVAALPSRLVADFLLRAPPALLTGTTQAQALQVVAFLKGLGIKPEHLWPRVICACPAVLAEDVGGRLAPLLSFLGGLGLEPAHVGRMACVFPELLTVGLEERVAPFVAYLTALGATPGQAATLLSEAPQALRAPPGEVFGGRVSALTDGLGLSAEGLAGVVRSSALFLTTKDAPHEQLAFLADELRLTPEQVRGVVTACPAVLAEKPLELQRKLAYLTSHLDMEPADVLAHPTFLGASLMQVIGPRHAFAVSRGLEAPLRAAGGACGSARVRDAGGAWAWDLTALVSGEDHEWVDRLGGGGSVNEYAGFRAAWEEEYAEALSAAAAADAVPAAAQRAPFMRPLLARAPPPARAALAAASARPRGPQRLRSAAAAAAAAAMPGSGGGAAGTGTGAAAAAPAPAPPDRGDLFHKGVAISVWQSSPDEGSNWTAFMRRRRFFGQPPDAFETSNDFWTHYEADVQLAASLGCNALRLSLEWARIVPRRGQVDAAAIARYHAILDACDAAGLAPFVTLHHFTHPTWFEEEVGGWDAPGSVAEFVSYAALAFTHFGARVPTWATFNEPSCYALCGHIMCAGGGGGATWARARAVAAAAREPTRARALRVARPAPARGLWAPGQRCRFAKAGRVLAHMLAAHGAAYRAIKAMPGGDAAQARPRPRRGRAARPAAASCALSTLADPVRRACARGQVGLVHQFIRFVPTPDCNPLSRLLVAPLCRWMTYWFATDATLAALSTGEFAWRAPLRGEVLRVALPDTAGALDFLGVNYYSRPAIDGRFRLTGTGPAEPLTDMGMPLVASDLHAHLLAAHAALRVPLLVTETGVSDARHVMRERCIATYYNEILRAIADGVDVRGAYYWTLLDNIEWHHGFNQAFGLFEWRPTPGRPASGAALQLRPGAEALVALHRAWPDSVAGVRAFAARHFGGGPGPRPGTGGGGAPAEALLGPLPGVPEAEAARVAADVEAADAAAAAQDEVGTERRPLLGGRISDVV
ncbi:RSP2 [Scenedesmus sp. PABB004]|nr:RSP2 [Scenedesmus sp. PABB004]